ncbi:hypothetical protein CEE36_08435 [candidate division TA06 bacterium B3_TA06]|uniref:FlgD/Vpr Ig-like domain-containing protein n=1 Tax=candidate division TA06 bacterium B3_TA06 TaxID=2012487 RepID=A0A532V2B6_UNCT6|nr:MAG: hypothetical protein CEE36_08435 [candidate division TA06 bacterium B3_TA06]
MIKQRANTSLAGLAMLLFAITLAAQVTEEWVARYDGPESRMDRANAIAVDDAGNVYVTGRSGGDYATVKYSSAGVQQWVARYDDPASGWDEAYAIAVDGAGNVYVTGTDWDYATFKYNSSGLEEWVARYDGPGSGIDLAYALTVDDAGNVYVTGHSDGSGTAIDYATVKYNSSGVEEWVARYDGPPSSIDEACAIALDGSGNVYVTGHSYGSGTDDDYATVKYSSSGVQQWAARYNGPASDVDRANAIGIDDAGNVYVTGSSYASGNLVDYATVKYSQGPGVAEASPDVPGHRLEVAQLTPEPVITYTLPSSSPISLKVYDVTGQLVRTLVSDSQDAGTHTVTWDGTDDAGRKLSAGLYFIRITTPRFSRFAKVVMIR